MRPGLKGICNTRGRYASLHSPTGIMSTSAQNTEPVTVEPAVEPTFWATYETTASEYDDKFLERANQDIGIILTFVCSSLCLSLQV